MPQSVHDAIRNWLQPVIIAALVTVCSILWSDMREQQKATADKLSLLNDAVVRLTALQDIR